MSDFKTRNVDELAAAETGDVSEIKARVENDSVDIASKVDLDPLFCRLASLKHELTVECQEVDKMIAILQKSRSEKEEKYAPYILEAEEKIRAEILTREKTSIK